ncbi:hypothetical protein V866_005398 [Kwoniella sp. B9012]
MSANTQLAELYKQFLHKSQLPVGTNAFRLDKEGKPAPYSAAYAAVHAQKSRLPAYQHIEVFYEGWLNRKSQVTIVAGGTGSGKSTQTPQAILYANLFRKIKGKIIMTQPRQIAAEKCVRRAAEELDYGVLLNLLCQDPELSGISVVILDEIHEMSENMELALGCLLSTLQRRPDLRVVLMSATGNVTDLKSHFKDFQPIAVELQQQNLTIDSYCLGEKVDDWCRASAQLVRQLLVDENNSLPSGHVIVFCPGEQQIHQLWEILDQFRSDCPQYWNQVDLEVLFRDLGHKDQEDALREKSTKVYWEEDRTWRKVVHRKVLLVTNIAETSVTITGASYVIDCGQFKRSEYNAQWDSYELTTVACAQDQITQRKGRVGRTSKGFHFGIWPEGTTFAPHSKPNLLRSNLESLFLRIYSMDIHGGVGKFQFFTQPYPEQISRANHKLKVLGFIHEKNGHYVITEEGELAIKIGLEPGLARLFLNARRSMMADEILKLIAVLEVGHLIKANQDVRKLAEDEEQRLSHEFSDHFTLLNIFNAWQQHQKTRMGVAFGRRTFLHWSALLTVEARYADLKRRWTKNGFQQLKPLPVTGEAREHASKEITLIMFTSFGHNLAVRIIDGLTPNGEPKIVYRNIKESDGHWQSQDLYLPHDSHLRGTDPMYVLYSSLTYVPGKRKLYMSTCTAISEELLRILDPTFDASLFDRVGECIPPEPSLSPPPPPPPDDTAPPLSP